MKLTFIIFSILLLTYMLLPSPLRVEDFGPLPQSLKSDEPGDTVQVKNVSAYYSNHFRDFVMPYYKTQYQSLTDFPFAPMRFNHPPEFAYTAVKEQTLSTYLEELVYPLRDSIFINGFEPFYKDGEPKFPGATDLVVNGIFFDTKTTLRFYPSPLWARTVAWFGICLSILMLWNLGRRILKFG